MALFGHSGRSHSAIAERVRRLEELGIITSYRVVVDPARLGLGITALGNTRCSVASVFSTATFQPFRIYRPHRRQDHMLLDRQKSWSSQTV